MKNALIAASAAALISLSGCVATGGVYYEHHVHEPVIVGSYYPAPVRVCQAPVLIVPRHEYSEHHRQHEYRDNRSFQNLTFPEEHHRLREQKREAIKEQLKRELAIKEQLKRELAIMEERGRQAEQRQRRR